MFQIEVLTGGRIKYPDKMVKLFFDIDLPIIIKRREESILAKNCSFEKREKRRLKIRRVTRRSRKVVIRLIAVATR